MRLLTFAGIHTRYMDPQANGTAFRNCVMTGVQLVAIAVLVICLALIVPISMWMYFWPLAKELSDERLALLAPLGCENPGMFPLLRAPDLVRLLGMVSRVNKFL